MYLAVCREVSFWAHLHRQKPFLKIKPPFFCCVANMCAGNLYFVFALFRLFHTKSALLIFTCRWHHLSLLCCVLLRCSFLNQQLGEVVQLLSFQPGTSVIHLEDPVHTLLVFFLAALWTSCRHGGDGWQVWQPGEFYFFMEETQRFKTNICLPFQKKSYFGHLYTIPYL